LSRNSLWIGGYGPENSAHGTGLATFAETFANATGGEVDVDITWNIMDDGRPNTDLFTLVESGEMFLCYFSSSYLGDRVPALNVLETPYLFEDLDAAHRALDGPLGEHLAEAVRAATPFEVLGFWDNGFRHFTNRLRPVRSPADCAGMTVRMQPNTIHEALITAWGATPVAVELSEAVRLITDLAVDAQENPLANTVAYGVDAVHPYVTMTGHLYGARGLFANRAAIQAMPDDIAAIVRSAARQAIHAQRSAAADYEIELRQRLEAGGTEIIDLGAAERDAFVRASQPAIELAHAGVADSLFELAGA
jgi:TRAP-type transport system periplasmic protein